MTKKPKNPRTWAAPFSSTGPKTTTSPSRNLQIFSQACNSRTIGLRPADSTLRGRRGPVDLLPPHPAFSSINVS